MRRSFCVPMTCGVTAGYLAIRYPKEANLKEDERERSIHLKGTHAAYYPLVIGSYGIMGALFNQLSTALLINLLLAVIICAELVRVGWQLPVVIPAGTSQIRFGRHCP